MARVRVRVRVRIRFRVQRVGSVRGYLVRVTPTAPSILVTASYFSSMQLEKTWSSLGLGLGLRMKGDGLRIKR